MGPFSDVLAGDKGLWSAVVGYLIAVSMLVCIVILAYVAVLSMTRRLRPEPDNRILRQPLFRRLLGRRRPAGDD